MTRILVACLLGTLLGGCTTTTKLAPVDESSSSPSEQKVDPEILSTRQAPPADEAVGSKAAGFRKECMAGDHAQCAHLGFRYENGADGAGRDLRRAVFFYGKACNGGSPSGCALLGILYRDGKGLERNRQQSLDMFEKSCEGKPDKDAALGCFMLADMILKGSPDASDVQRADELLRRACISGMRSGCFRLADRRERSKDYSQAAAYYGAACEKGEDQACGRLGRLLLDGKHQVANPAAVARMLRPACDHGDKPSCDAIGTLDRQGSSPAGSIRFRCPGGETPTAVRAGCMCGDEVHNPCKLGGTFPAVEGDTCVFHCPDPNTKLPPPKDEMEKCLQECNDETGWRFMGQCQMSCEDKLK